MTTQRPPRKLGAGHDEFWAGCAADELRLPRCTACQKLQWPIAPQCDQCGGEDLRWERVSGDGVLISWCSFHQDYYKGMIPTPYETILVKLAEGPLFISNPEGFGREAMQPEAPVKVAFIDAEDSAGSFRLPVFRLATGSRRA